MGASTGILAPMMNNITWIFKDGASEVKCTSFPYAYRTMFNALKKGVESGRKYNDMVKQMTIISPQKDVHGDLRRYNYTTATEMAKASGLLISTGEIDFNEFKKKYFPRGQ
jgi:hypothetical protein